MNRLKPAVLVLLLLVCAAKAVLHWRRPTLDDFKVYETAARLVEEHHSLLIYNGADTGVDPQLRFAEPQSAFGREAAKLGIPEVRMYVYPPVLADLLVPLSGVNARAAGRFWVAFNAGALVAFCWLCAGMLRLRSHIAAMAALVITAATYYPALDCLHWGQITIALLVLWTLGLFCYARGWMGVSAFALALATSIKLTPLLAVVPFVLWKEWRWLRAYALSLGGLFAGMLLVNGPACLADYFRHVAPSMSNGNISLANRSLISCLQLVYLTSKGVSPEATFLPVSHGVGVLGKGLSLLLLGAATWLVARHRESRSLTTRLAVLAVFPLLSVVLSPVSWGHAYALCLLTLVVLWAEALREPVPTGYFALLAVASLELNWFEVSFVLREHTHGLGVGLVSTFPVLCGLALVLYRLAAIPRFAAAEQVALEGRAV